MKKYSTATQCWATPRFLPTLSLSLLLALAACAPAPLQVPEKLVYDRTPQVTGSNVLGTEKAARKYSESDTPTPPATTTQNVGTENKVAAPLDDARKDLSVSFDQMPLPTFIHAIYGNVIKANYSLDPAVAARTDLVTFRTAKPQSAQQMSTLARMLLKSYGIAVQDFGGVIRIVPDNATTSYNPLIRRGRALPEAAASLRPMFNYVELEAVRVSDFLGFLRTMFGSRIQVQEDPQRNALLMSGQPDDVAAAMEVVQVFDQPLMRGQRSKRISPVFLSADEFSRRLIEVLTAEGYAAGNSPSLAVPILVLPIAPLNSVIVFTNSDKIMSHVLKWARELDRPSVNQTGGAYFTYAVKFADAQQLAKTLGELINSPVAAPAAPGTPASPRSSSKIVVNNATNSLIIQGGSAEEYRQWITLLTELDKPTKSALIDVMVAEVTLSATDKIGVDWNFGAGHSRSLNGIIQSAAAGSTGLQLNFLNAAGLVKGALSALASDGDARILSSPKIMARNGETATIQVGDEVPVLTSQSTTNPSFGVGTTTTQTVQYRTTGIILKVRPVINSGSRIDLDISQEVSNAIPTDSGVNSSPTIQTRKVDTKLSLRDGSTVMLAGIIKNNVNKSNNGVPFLKDIPLLGNAFKSETRSNDKTEMIILITPYIINDEYEAEAITDAYQNNLGEWAKNLRERSLLNRQQRVSNASTEPAKPMLANPPVIVSSEEKAPASAPSPATLNAPAPAPQPAAASQKKADDTNDVTMSKPATPLPPPKNLSTGIRPAGAPPVVQGKPVADSGLLEELRRAAQAK